ncbi:MAG: hypothetical protein ACK55I_29070, partial [bacterium]
QCRGSSLSCLQSKHRNNCEDHVKFCNGIKLYYNDIFCCQSLSTWIDRQLVDRNGDSAKLRQQS